MNYVFIHVCKGQKTAYPFASKSKTVLEKHIPDKIARVLGVEYDPDEDQIYAASLQARPLDFDAMLAAAPTEPEE